MKPGLNCTRLLAVFFSWIALLAASKCEAADYPARPVRWVVGYPPGGTTDILARLIGHWLSERLGQQFVIENKPGAGNNIGAEAVVNSRPDGYTVLLVNPANAINATLYRKLSFNFVRDIVPVAGIMRVPNVMEVNPSVPAKTVAEFIAYAKANPGSIYLASSGNGTSVHLSGELFKIMAAVDLTHVPYRGSAPALTDLISGTVQVMFDNMPSSLPYIRTGKLRALGVTTAKRSDALPDVGAPKGTPADIVDKLNKEINAALVDPAMKAKLTELGGMIIPGTPAEFGTMVAQETEKWADVIKTGGVSLE